MSKPSSALPTYFLSHGGGPWPWMKAEMPGVYDELARSLAAIPAELPTPPRAILVITAHWIEREFVASAHPRPGMIYDFGGFPAHTYQVKYPAPGSPALAARVQALLQASGLPARLDATRGFDHGTYTPLAPMYPDAQVPVVQLSIQKRFDPAAHLAVGRALAPLRQEGVLILGSGLSFHNLGMFDAEALAPSQAFDQWLQTTMAASPAERWQKLLDWRTAPAARTAHPQADHLIPLLVAAGAAEHDKVSLIYHEEAFMGAWCVSSFRFGP